VKTNSLRLQPQEIEKLYQDVFYSVSDGLIIIDPESKTVMAANPAASKMHGYSVEDFLKLPLTALLHPESHDDFLEFLQEFQSKIIFEKTLRHIRLDGSTFYCEWHSSKFLHHNRPFVLGVVRDISSRIKAEEGLHHRVEIRTHEQTTLLKISHTLASTLEFHPGLILDQLHEIIAYTRGGLFALEDSTLTALAIRGVNNLDPAPPFHIHLQGPEVLSTLFIGHKPVRVADVWNDHPQSQLLRSLLLDETAGLLEGINSWMWVPLEVRRHIIGVIGIAETRKNFFTIHHADLALSVANQAAITMVNADLIKQAQELAVLEERQRLARNLHDAVNQSLFSAGLIAEVLPRLWERDHQEALISLDDLRRLTRGAQAEMRALLAELRPSTITDSKLGDLLRLLANALTGRTSIPVQITSPDDLILPADVQITFYRICQETLNNVAKHSKARHVEIVLKQDGNDIVLRIHDDGRGFDPNLTISGHYGIGMMHERADRAGALFSINSQPGQGTDTILHWIQPIPKGG
jgi:two-component system nitrate/nitrite sensor histidine kinase NarX